MSINFHTKFRPQAHSPFQTVFWSRLTSFKPSFRPCHDAGFPKIHPQSKDKKKIYRIYTPFYPFVRLFLIILQVEITTNLKVGLAK